MKTRITQSIQSMQPLYRQIPKLQDLILTSVSNSIVVCRLCRGTRLIAKESSVFHSYTFEKCYICNGSGIMSNRESDYDT